ncbi:MAG TPA: acyl-CoA dehydrogenase family protein [Dehalococcoidia bacterium]|nr:acyl-CoA dehydrogenase family protein [Dehalococcoidia bacterium]
MRLTDSPEEAAWRKTVRDFLEKELPEALRPDRNPNASPFAGMGGEGAGPEVRGRPEARAGGAGFQLAAGPLGEWRQKLAARGWIAPAWPKEYGGAGLTTMEQFILNEEFAEMRAPQLGGMGVSMAGPTIIVHGTEEQKAEHLPKILRGETQWCQGFSEPGAGSDLASLQTRAVKDGDDFVINGSKIWTSGAQFANWMFMLARTDPDAPKHRGITYFLVDMKTPGITVQPLVTMAGTAVFNQVFFDNVRVPAKNVVGEVNRGWYVGTTTLDFERSGIGSAVGTRQNVERMIKWAKENVGGQSMLDRNPLVRLELADRLIEAHVAKMLSYRVVHMQNVGMIPNHEASMAKLFSSELGQRIARTGMKMIGLFGLAWDPQSRYAPNRAQYSRSYVSSVSSTIAGGTSEIQRNIIAQRGLGLPRD